MFVSRISTGSKELDYWLGGGYERDVITTIYGPAGSGKTNLCLLAAATQASFGKKVIYIDTEGGFSAERLKQIASREVMKNIFLLRATKFSEQHEAFNKLLELINRKVGLIVVDSISMLYRLELSIANQERDFEKVQTINRALARQLRILAEIARKKYIPVLVTNQVYSEFLSKEDFEAGKEKSVSMVGGDLLKYWSKCIIELQNLEGKKRAILRKHRSLPEKEFFFKIVEKGIKKAD
ncbi:MAG: DNA repair and recombination protein RadB [Candidatus Pacearchaeota archaeon]|nr:DNA repair and recombination protein RadB [Candidatus Pacearchaeota archaeon]